MNVPYNQPQGTCVALYRARTLRGGTLIPVEQLADCCIIIAEFERLGSASGISPKGFYDLRGDSLGGGYFFSAGTAAYFSMDSIDGWSSKSNTPIVSAWRWVLKKYFPRCAANWYE
jgi:hypothetical protein